MSKSKQYKGGTSSSPGTVGTLTEVLAEGNDGGDQSITGLSDIQVGSITATTSGIAIDTNSGTLNVSCSNAIINCGDNSNFGNTNLNAGMQLSANNTILGDWSGNNNGTIITIDDANEKIGLSGFVGINAVASSSSNMVIKGGTTGVSSFRILSGVAPTSPVNGDIWFDATNLFMRIGGVTKTFVLV